MSTSVHDAPVAGAGVPTPGAGTRTSRRPTHDGAADAFLVVDDLSVQFPTEDGLVKAVQNVSYSLPLGRTLAIVGESGSGKSVSSMAIMGLHDPKRTIITGSITLGGEQIVGRSQDDMRKIRGQAASIIFQDPQSSLHPYFTVGWQLREAYREHHQVSKSVAHTRAIEMLDRVGIPHPKRRADQYPFEFSGGMRQRAMIAMALINDPQLIIADEPTTALDVTVQAQILDLLNDLQAEFGSAIIMITHDLAVVAEVADDVMVMYGGRAVEHGTAEQVLVRPNHPYTWGLLQSIPAVSSEQAELYPIKGNPPSLLSLPPGCSFAPRCPYVDRVPDGKCRTDLPELISRSAGDHGLSRCHLSNPDAIFAAEVEPRIA